MERETEREEEREEESGLLIPTYLEPLPCSN